MIVACQAPFGASTSTTSPTLRPSTAEPSGDVGDTVPSPPTALTSTVIVRPLPSISTTEPMPTSSEPASGTISAQIETRAQRADARLEQALLVLRRVVLEVLGEVAELARGLDRLHDALAARAFELGELDAQRVGLLLGELLAVYHFDASPAPRRVDETGLRHLHAGLLETLDVTLQPRDARDVGLLLGQHERDRDATLAGAAGAADAVRVDRQAPPAGRS